MIQYNQIFKNFDLRKNCQIVRYYLDFKRLQKDPSYNIQFSTTTLKKPLFINISAGLASKNLCNQ